MKDKHTSIEELINGSKGTQLLDVIGDAVSIQDTDFRILYQNRAQEELNGKHVGDYCYKVYANEESVCRNCAIAKCFSDGKVHKTEQHSIIDGRKISVEITASPLKDANGNIIAGMETVRDITDRRKAEEKIYEIKESYDRITDNADEVIFKVDARGGQVLYANPAAERLLGYSLEEYRADPELAFKIIHPDYIEQQQQIIEDINRSKSTIKNAVLGWICKNGRNIIIEYTIIPVKNQEGEIVFFESIGRDITERTRMEEKKTILIKTIETATEAISVVSPEGMITYTNPAMDALFGYDKGELIGESPGILNAGPNLEHTVHTIMESLNQNGVWKGEVHNRKKDGTAFTSYASLSTLKDQKGKVVNILSTQHDISKQKEAEEALRKSEKELGSIYDSITDFMTVINTDYRIIRTNRTVDSLYGKDVIGRLCYETYQGRSDICPGCPTKQAMETKKPAFSFQPPTELSPPVDIYAFPILDEEGEVIAVVEHGKDVSDRVQAEQKLAQLASIVKSSDDAIIGKLLDGTIVSWNPGAERLYGYTEEEIKGKSVSSLVPPERPDDVPGILEKIKRGEPVDHYETVRKKKSGERIDVALTVSPIRDSSQNLIGASTISRDITERKRTERELELNSRFLSIANQNFTVTELLKMYLEEIKAYSFCSAVGIRILDKLGNIPYEAYDGFSLEFYAKESPLSIHSDQCMCISVITGEIDRNQPCFTEGGSFHINGTTKFLAQVPATEQGKTRNMCNKYGYESVALIPIRLGDRIMGVIHLADTREDGIPSSTVTLLEQLALQIGSSIQRIRSEEDLRKSRDELEIKVKERTAELKKTVDLLEEGMSERKKALDALTESEKKYRSLFEQAPDSILLIQQETADIIDFNDSACQNLGYTSDEFRKLKISDIEASESEDEVAEHIRNIINKGYDNFETRHRTKDGQIRDIRVNARMISIEKKNYIQSILTDITERKQHEDKIRAYQLQLRNLMSKMSNIEDQERKRISEELHDNISQNLAISAINLKALQEEGGTNEREINRIRLMIEETIEYTRSLMFELSPTVLYELGFKAAIEWLTEEFHEKHGLEIQFRSSGRFRDLKTEICLLLFKTIRELLFNIVKHAMASDVLVFIKNEGYNIVINVDDDGKGFDTSILDSVPDKDGGFGLLNVREKIEYLGGTFKITSEPGKGTTVSIVVPVQEKNDTTGER